MSATNPSSGTCGGGGGGRLLLARAASSQAAAQLLHNNLHDEDSNQLSVDTDFDSYWEEEARNPHRNRIRIGRQYQATVPAVSANSAPLVATSQQQASADEANLLTQQQYHLERQAAHLETLSFCPSKAAQLTDAELHHYFTVAKSLNLFAELVQTRSLLGRDVTIADLNRIRNKEGLSLASVIQPPPRQPTTTTTTTATTSSPPQDSPQVSASTAALVSPPTAPHSAASSSSPVQSPKEQSSTLLQDSTASAPQPVNQALMKALSHFISLHHPCHHDTNCKKLGFIGLPQEEDHDQTTVSDNLRQVAKPLSSRSRSALKQQSSTTGTSKEEPDGDENVCNPKLQPGVQEWSREEIELFSKAIEVCGKNFGSIKKEFLPTKSVRSIVEYYYIGLRGDSTGAEGSIKRKASQNSLETTSATEPTSCSPDKSSPANNNNNSHGGGDGGGGPSSSNGSKNGQHANSPSNTDNTASTGTHVNRTQLTSPSGNETNSTNRQATNYSDYTHFSSLINTSTTGNPQPPVPGANGVRQPQISTSSTSNTGNKNIDARMSVYNFDDEFKDEPTNSTPPSAVQFDASANNSGLGVRPLKAKPIMPNALIDSDSANSNLGSLKFFMDGQLILKLNACQDQQEGQEKCHWVQSGERLISANSKHKKLTKRPNRLSDGQLINGSQSNSLVSSFQDDDSKTGAEFVNDEDSKESLSSSLSQSSSQHPTTINHQLRNQSHQLTSSSSSPSSNNKRLKMSRNMAVDSTANTGAALLSGHQQLPSPINYNRLAVDNNNRIKENNSSIHSPLNPDPAINQQAAAAAAAMPWLQANSFAMAAALLGQLPFPTNPAANMVEQPLAPPPTLQGNINSISTHNLTSKPMDLSLEHTTTTTAPNKSIQSTNSSKSTSRSKSNRPKKA